MLLSLLVACTTGLDTGVDTFSEAHEAILEEIGRANTPEPPSHAEACDGATLMPEVVHLDRSWSMATWAGCATRVHIECPAWVTLDSPRSVVTGDVALFMAGPITQDGAPAVARCGIITDQGRGEIVMVWGG